MSVEDMPGRQKLNEGILLSV